MNLTEFEAARRARITAQIAREFPNDTEDERNEYIEETIEEELMLEAEERTEHLNSVEDAPSLQSANIYGGNEGQYHGIIG
jgi:hypothetical protein